MIKNLKKCQNLYPNVRFNIIDKYFDFKSEYDPTTLHKKLRPMEERYDYLDIDDDFEIDPEYPGKNQYTFSDWLEGILNKWFSDGYEKDRFDELFYVYNYLPHYTGNFIFLGEFDYKEHKMKLYDIEKEDHKIDDDSKYTSVADIEYYRKFRYQQELYVLKKLLNDELSNDLKAIHLVIKGKDHKFESYHILTKTIAFLMKDFSNEPIEFTEKEIKKMVKRKPSDIHKANLTLSLYNYVIKEIIPDRTYALRNIYAMIGEMLVFGGILRDQGEFESGDKVYSNNKKSDGATKVQINLDNEKRYIEYLRSNVKNWIKVGKELKKN